MLGPNGAGKTTTLHMLAGLLKPTTGNFSFIGLQGDIRQWIGFLPQYPAFYGWMNGEEFLTYVGKLARMKGKKLSDRVEQLLNQVGLSDAKHKRISGYSGGMKQRLGIAQALIHQPRLLLLDEPVSALDPIGRREVLGLLQQIKQETTLLFSTHVLHDAEQMCEDILIMRKGELVISGSLEQVKQQHQQPVITVKATQSLADWAENIRKEVFVTQLKVMGSTVTVEVNDLAAAKPRLLRSLLDHNVDLLAFEVAQTSLEDLFMKVVQQ